MKNGRGGGMAAGGKIENEDLKNKVKRGKEKGRKLHKKRVVPSQKIDRKGHIDFLKLSPLR